MTSFLLASGNRLAKVQGLKIGISYFVEACPCFCSNTT